jgi:hypothetical protein
LPRLCRLYRVALLALACEGVAAGSKFDAGRYTISEEVPHTDELVSAPGPCSDIAADHWSQIKKNDQMRIEKEDFLDYYVNTQYGKALTANGTNYNLYVAFLGDLYDVGLNMMKSKGAPGTIGHHTFAHISTTPYNFAPSVGPSVCAGHKELDPTLMLASKKNSSKAATLEKANEKPAQSDNASKAATLDKANEKPAQSDKMGPLAQVAEKIAEDTTGACVDKGTDHWKQIPKNENKRVEKVPFMTYWLETKYGKLMTKGPVYNMYVSYLGSIFDLAVNMAGNQPGSPGTIGHHNFAAIALLPYAYYHSGTTPACLGAVDENPM